MKTKHQAILLLAMAAVTAFVMEKLTNLLTPSMTTNIPITPASHKYYKESSPEHLDDAEKGGHDNNENTLMKQNHGLDYGSNHFTTRNKGNTHKDYIWLGNHWIPPNGIPTFTPRDFLEYFKTRNTLILGDSLGRRAHRTFLGMVNSTDLNNIHIDAMDTPSILNINYVVPDACLFRDRSLFNFRRCESCIFWCHNFSHEDGYSGVAGRHNNEEPHKIIGPAEKGKFDYLRVVCFQDLVPLIDNPKKYYEKLRFNEPERFDESLEFDASKNKTFSFLDDYDLLVVILGAWEPLETCQSTITKDEKKYFEVAHMNAALEYLKNISSPNLQIIFRTPGFYKDHRFDSYNWQMINATNTFFEKLTSEVKTSVPGGGGSSSNMTLVDWGSNILSRSHGLDRIEGDHVHYGLEARLLLLQQLLHQLLFPDYHTTP